MEYLGKTSILSRLHNSNDSQTLCPEVLLHIHPFSPYLPVSFPYWAGTQNGCCIQSYPPNKHLSLPASNMSPSPCEFYSSSDPHTQFVLRFSSVPTSGAWKGWDGVSLQIQWSMAEHVCLWTRDQCCCLLWQTACDSWSVATATVCAITQCLAKALCTAKFLPFPFLPTKACPTEMIHISLWYLFLTSLVMKSH